MSSAAASSLEMIVIVSDGIRGHVNQSRGVARHLAEMTGARTMEVEIPRLAGVDRIRAKSSARRMLVSGGRRSARDWLVSCGGEELMRELETALTSIGAGEGDAGRLLLISAGTAAALFNIAFGWIWRCSCATLMTPSVIGTAPFDFAIVPDHDRPRPAPNVLTTLGAPNLVVREELASLGDELMRAHPPESAARWGILIGGDDKNYRISADWTRRVVGGVLREAERRGADVYMTTSRRTSAGAEAMLRRLAASCGRVRYAQWASEDSTNSVPAILGACGEVFVSDDSVSMVSETATAGARAIIMRTERPGGLRTALADLCAGASRVGLFPKRLVWGAHRFAATLDRFRSMGLAVSLEEWMEEPPDAPRGRSVPDFCEARRAAEWIVGRLPSIAGREEQR